jgi:hypothetical protein
MDTATESPASGRILPISSERLVALVHPYELDGRVSSHPLDERGFSTMNCYLFLEDEHALLYSTGYSVHEQALMTQSTPSINACRPTQTSGRIKSAGAE